MANSKHLQSKQTNHLITRKTNNTKKVEKKEKEMTDSSEIQQKETFKQTFVQL